MGRPGDFLNSATISGLGTRALGRGHPGRHLSLVLWKIQKFKASRAANGWCRGGCLRAGGQAGESPVVPQGGRPATCFPFPASHHPPTPPRPSQHSPQRRFIRGGRARHGRASRGCFLAQWTRHFWCVQEGTEHSVHFGGLRDSWTDTSVLSHATRLVVQPPSLPPSLPPPPIPTSHPLQSRLLRNHSKWPQEVNTWIT